MRIAHEVELGEIVQRLGSAPLVDGPATPALTQRRGDLDVDQVGSVQIGIAAQPVARSVAIRARRRRAPRPAQRRRRRSRAGVALGAHVGRRRLQAQLAAAALPHPSEDLRHRRMPRGSRELAEQVLLEALPGRGRSLAEDAVDVVRHRSWLGRFAASSDRTCTAAPLAPSWSHSFSPVSCARASVQGEAKRC